jgi:ankyrin repeat protein
MPPTGALPRDEIDILKRWIDEGAVWPEALANERDLPAPDSDATRLIEAIRRSDRSAALEEIAATPSILNKPGPGGATPLMQAALAGDAGLVGAMLQKGADPNRRNHVGASALMWALENVGSVELLLDAGADANATSDFGRTPLTLAAAQAGAAPVVKLLLNRGASPAPQGLHPLRLAATRTLFGSFWPPGPGTPPVRPQSPPCARTARSAWTRSPPLKRCRRCATP